MVQAGELLPSPLERPESMEEMRRAFNALGNRKRLKIVVSLLQSGEISVGEIARHHRMHRTTASRHLGKLEAAGLVKTRQHGPYVYYSADTRSSSTGIRSILRTIQKSPKRRVK